MYRNRIIILIAVLCWLLPVGAGAQQAQSKKWRAGVSVQYTEGSLLLMPRLDYRLSHNLSLSAIALLPVNEGTLATEDNTMGGELRLNSWSPLSARLDLGVALSAGYGRIGGFSRGGYTSPYGDQDYHSRSWIGLRPMVRYRVSDGLAVQASWGLWGYMHNHIGTAQAGDVARTQSHLWGFTTSSRYGAGLEIGFVKKL